MNSLGVEGLTPRGWCLLPASRFLLPVSSPVFIPPDHSKGDESTIGGYMAVHARPAAFEGSDGAAYSVEIECDETDDPAAPWGAFLLFVKWSSGGGEPKVSGHLESEFLARGDSEETVRKRVGDLPLGRVREILDMLIRERAPRAERPWWEVMRDEDDEGDAPRRRGDE